MKIRIRRPSPALVVAVLALVVAMSGAAVAAEALHNGDKLIAKRTLSGNRLRANTVTGAEVSEGKLGVVPKANLAYHLPKLVWHKLTLINNWEDHTSNLRPPAWALDVQGMVHLRGTIDETSNIANQFTTLPAAIRPADSVWIATSLSDAQPGTVAIDELGRAYAFDPAIKGNERARTSLDGITYALR